MKKRYGFMSVTALALLLTGCSEEEKDIKNKEETVASQTAKTDIKPKEKKEVSPIITFVEFEKSNKRDSKEKSYIDSLFILKSGEKVNADYIMYADGNYYDYTSVIFHEGILARIKLETSASIEEVEAGLGVTFGDGIKLK